MLAPTDKQIEDETIEILRSSDISRLSLKQIRQQLEIKFNCLLAEKKDVIKRTLNEFLENDESAVDLAKSCMEVDSSSSGIDMGEAGKAESVDTVPTKKVRKNGFVVPVQLSEELSEFLGGENMMARTEVVKRMWQYIREHDLQNPKDRREILCDEKLIKLFKRKKFTAFKMSKFLSVMMKKVSDLQASADERAEEDERKAQKIKDNQKTKNVAKIKEDKAIATDDGKPPSKKKRSRDSCTEESLGGSTKLRKTVSVKDEAKQNKKSPTKSSNKSETKAKFNQARAGSRISDALAEVLSIDAIQSRPQVVKYMWEYIRKQNLQNPKDKREIVLDDRLKEVFKVSKFTIFSMNKYLSDHIGPID